MKINLADLASQTTERYKDVECTFGEIRVYHTPEPLIWSLKPSWYPQPLPQIEMVLANGQKQRRSAKQGDSEYREWQQENSRWEQEKSEIQTAGRYVIALQDVEYPTDLSSPPPFVSGILNGILNGNYPANELLRKKVWLDATVLARASDLAKIMAAMMELGGAETVTDEDVDDVKKSSALDSEDIALIELDHDQAEKT